MGPSRPGSATYEICFRLPIPNPNPITDPNPNNNKKENDTGMKFWLLFRTQDPTAQQCIKHSGEAHVPNCERHAPVQTQPDVTMHHPSLRCRNRNN